MEAPKPTKEQLERGACPGFMYDRHLWPCSKKPVRDGYCGTHHPDAEKRRQEKMEARSKVRAAQRDQQDKAAKEFQRRGLAYPRLMAEIKKLKQQLSSRPPHPRGSK